MNSPPSAMKGNRCGQHAMSCKLRKLGLGLESGLLDWQPPRATPWFSNLVPSKRRRRSDRDVPPRRHARSPRRDTLALEASHVWRRLQGAFTTPPCP